MSSTGKAFRKLTSDDVVLVAEVLVEIAGADVQFVGDVVGGDAWLADLIEELQTGLDNAVAGFQRWGRVGRGHGQLDDFK